MYEYFEQRYQFLLDEIFIQPYLKSGAFGAEYYMAAMAGVADFEVDLEIPAKYKWVPIPLYDKIYVEPFIKSIIGYEAHITGYDKYIFYAIMGNLDKLPENVTPADLHSKYEGIKSLLIPYSTAKLIEDMDNGDGEALNIILGKKYPSYILPHVN
jgi:hypothetical protein